MLLTLGAAAWRQQPPPPGSEPQQEVKKPRRIITNDDIPERLEVQEYPAVGLRFAVPRHWEKLRPEGNTLVRTMCPGFPESEHNPKKQEEDRCGLYVGTDGLPSCCRDNAHLALANLRVQLLEKHGREVAEWREFTFTDAGSGLKFQAAAHTIETAAPKPVRRMRIIYIASPERNRIYLVGLLAEPKSFDRFSRVLDTVVNSLEIIAR